MSHGECCLFAPAASAAYGARLATALGVPLSPLEERDFEDGEHKARPLVSVRGKDVYVVQSLHGGGGSSVDEKLCRLLFLLATLADASAARITAVLPYLCYARKDRRTQARDPVTSRYVAQLIEASGADRVLALDVHNPAAFQNAFRCPTDHLEATSLFADHFAALLGGQKAVVVSPDAGGVKRAERFRQALARATGQEVAMAFAEKHRDGRQLTGEALIGEVAGRVAIVFDDLISTGATIARAARTCRNRGAIKVYAAASHGVFAAAAAATLATADLAGLAITDSIFPTSPNAAPLADKLTVLSAAALMAAAIRAIHEDGSVSALSGD